jgi:hypothetical protein
MPLLQGAIVIWSGSTLDIPQGWQLCDGTNNTPDLRNRFIVGAGDLYNVGDAGGSADAILPQHTHTAVTSTSATHTHIYGRPAGGSGTGAMRADAADELNQGTGGAGEHTHSTPTSTNTAGTGETGVGKNLPPYFALCYIQQI